MPPITTQVESAKQRSLRAAIDHYERAPLLVWGKYAVAGAAALVAILYVAWTLWAGQQQASPGQVAAAHAAWNNDCQSCHTSFRPLNANAVNWRDAAAPAEAHRQLRDSNCAKCHAVQSAAHHNNQRAADVSACATCHADHRGTDADIARPADQHCTSCHADLRQHLAAGATTAFDDVTRFAVAAKDQKPPHPDFDSLQTDPGNLKFNHWLHMQPGSSDAAATKEVTEQGELIQLKCADCHQPDAAGQYMRPIVFEQHCQACHPLEVLLVDEQKSAPNQVAYSLGFVPHGLQPQPLADALEGLAWPKDFQNQTTPGQQPPADRTDESGNLPLVPGKTLGNNLAGKINRDLLAKRDKAAQAIAARCEQCHDRAAGGGLLSFQSPQIPQRWFEHKQPPHQSSARFDHRAHEGFADCIDCHQAAFDTKPRRFQLTADKPKEGYSEPPDRELAMIDGLASCARCHAPAERVQGVTVSGKKLTPARFDCAECHQYHPHAAQPAARPPQASRSSQPEIKYVTFLSALRLNLTAPPVELGRLASCAAAGCHGDARPTAPAWRSAMARWLAADPHSQAYNVLWTARAREMTRRLTVPSPDDFLNDDGHAQRLRTDCIACHATDSQPASGAALSKDSFPLGVHCESCHDSKSEAWLHTHYDNPSRKAFADVEHCKNWASTCLRCHVGPNNATQPPQVVDHDLIAAGHPRLSFEFRAYVDSLPPHWSEAKTRGARTQMWSLGQSQLAAHTQALRTHYANANPPLAVPPGDFSLIDCAACHTSFRPEKWSQAAAGAIPILGPPRPALWERVQEWRTNNAQAPSHVYGQQVVEAACQPGSNFDDAVQAFLAAKAIAADYPRETAGGAALRTALDALGADLSRDCFTPAADRQWPTPYDTPQRFDPTRVTPLLRAVAAALGSLP